MHKQRQPEGNPFAGWTTMNEAAEIIGRDRAIVRFWADTGRITSYSVGARTRLVNINEVRAYAAQNPPYNTGKRQSSRNG